MKKLCIVLSLAGVASCCAPYEEKPPVVVAPKPTPEVVKVIDKKPGPPPHAKAHGYRRKFGYTYYPEQKVYHSKEKDAWFWLENGEWKVGAKLPAGIDVKDKAAEEIELESETPYEHFKEDSETKKHPGKGKAKGKDKDKDK